MSRFAERSHKSNKKNTQYNSSYCELGSPVVSQTLRAYIIITYFGSKETNISSKNVVNNLVLKHCYLHVILNFEVIFQKRVQMFSWGKPYLKILLSAVGGKKTFKKSRVNIFGGDCVCAIFVSVVWTLERIFLFYYFWFPLGRDRTD